MSDQKDNVKQLIGQLAVDDAKKQSLSAKLESEGVSDSLMMQISLYLNEMEKALDDQDPQEVKDLERAKAEFDKEMEEIEAEAKALDKSLNAELDAIDADKIRQSL